ncbi:MAG: glycerophosphoryl diester phosphodiesterase [Bacteriovoracaceae bacterium]|jgi:glycerophosphoryl diester phosphodiesterase
MKIAFTILFLMFSFLGHSKTLMVSHKGVWKNHVYAQNTMESLEQALNNGFRGIEFDVHLTADKKLVLAHDIGLKRVTNCKGKVTEKTLSALLKCKVTHNTKLPLTQILVKKVKKPTYMTSLKKVFDKLLAREKLEFLWVDVKGNDPKLIDALSEALVDVGDKSLISKIMINSVNTELLTRFKKAFPRIKTSLEGKWGSEPLSHQERFFQGIGISHDAISLNVGIALGFKGSLNIFIRKRRFWKLLKSYVSESKRRNIPTVSWTVSSKKKITKLKALDLDYLLTDLITP